MSSPFLNAVAHQGCGERGNEGQISWFLIKRERAYTVMCGFKCIVYRYNNSAGAVATTDNSELACIFYCKAQLSYSNPSNASIP